MPGIPLQNLRWERFCQAYVQGPTAGNATASYVAAGFAGEGTQTARAGAFRLLHKEPVRIRIAELQENLARIEERAVTKAADLLSLRKELVLKQLAQLGFANILDYLRRSETGALVVDLAAVDRDKGAGIVELVMTETGEGEDRRSSMRVRLGNRHAPLVSLGKHLGLFAEKASGGRDDVRQLSTEDLRERLAQLDRKLGDAEPPAADGVPQAALPPPEDDSA